MAREPIAMRPSDAAEQDARPVHEGRAAADREHRRRGLWWTILIAAALAAGLLWVSFRQVELVQMVEEDVRAAVPPGTPRVEAEKWLERQYGFVPSYTANFRDQLFQGRTIPEMAGVPAAELGGMVRTVAVRRGMVGRVVHQLHPDHVWVFLLLDQDGQVTGYYFLSLQQLRELESGTR